MRPAPLLTRGLAMLMVGHFTVDFYSGLLPVMYPILRDRFALDLGAIGLIATCATFTLSLSQPFFGLLIDRFGIRILGAVAVLWMGTFYALAGQAPSYWTVLLAVALAGLGSGAYHPLGASSVAFVTDPRRSNAALSLYTVGGTGGFSLAPLIGAALFGAVGLGGTAIFLPLALLVALWLAFGLGGVQRRRETATREAAQDDGKLQLRPLLALLGVMMLRSWNFMVLTSFLPILYRNLGYGPRFYSPLLFVIVVAGCLGTIVGGFLADRVNRRLVIVASLALLGPAFWLLLAFPGPGAFALGFVVGFVADFSVPAILTTAQGLVPGRAGVTLGIMLGIGFMMGGIGVSITGAVADRIGLTRALAFLPLLLVVALLLMLLVPGDARRGARREPDLARGRVEPAAVGAGE